MSQDQISSEENGINKAALILHETTIPMQNSAALFAEDGKGSIPANKRQRREMQKANTTPQVRSQRHRQSLNPMDQIGKSNWRSLTSKATPLAAASQSALLHHPLRVAERELRERLVCLSATLPMYCRLASSPLLRMDRQMSCPTGPRSVE